MATESFLVMVRRIDGNYSAFVPDVPGCIATGVSEEDARATLQRVLQVHLRSLFESKITRPVQSQPNYVEVEVPDDW